MLEVEHLTGIPIADLEAEIGAGRLRGVVDDQGLRRIHLDELDTFVARNRGVVVEVFFDLPSWKSEEEPGPIGDPLAVRSDKGVMRLVQYWDELTEDREETVWGCLPEGRRYDVQTRIAFPGSGIYPGGGF
jgi:hypothetical protein